MAEMTVCFFQEVNGDVPVQDWLDDLFVRDRRAYQKCLMQIARLRALGHELRRPTADYLRDGIHELRIRVGSVNFRILYFFHGRTAVVLAHGLKKEKSVPAADIERAIHRKRRFEANPAQHTHRE